MQVSLGIPTNRGFQPKTFQCLLEMVAHNKDIDWHFIVSSEGYTTAENRNYIAVQACNNKSDYLLMIDDDMTFPPDTLDTLLSDKKDIVGVAYHSREREGEIMSIVETNKNEYINLEKETDPKYKKTFECYATGTGIILIKTDVFKKVPQPWFEFTYYENGKCKEGEDWNFCFKAKDAGYKIYCDPTLKITHIGEIVI